MQQGNSWSVSRTQMVKGVQDPVEAAKWYQKARNRACCRTVQSWADVFQGRRSAKDAAEAVKWYRKAAEQGDAGAQCNLGVKYYRGEGVPKDVAEAVKWYRKAAEQGYAPAQTNLGFMYEKGEGVPKDTAEAVKCTEKLRNRAMRALSAIWGQVRKGRRGAQGRRRSGQVVPQGRGPGLRSRAE